ICEFTCEKKLGFTVKSLKISISEFSLNHLKFSDSLAELILIKKETVDLVSNSSKSGFLKTMISTKAYFNSFSETVFNNSSSKNSWVKPIGIFIRKIRIEAIKLK